MDISEAHKAIFLAQMKNFSKANLMGSATNRVKEIGLEVVAMKNFPVDELDEDDVAELTYGQLYVIAKREDCPISVILLIKKISRNGAMIDVDNILRERNILDELLDD